MAEVWRFFGGYHAYRLREMTHGEFPWQKARKGLSPKARSTEPIALADLKALGLQKLELMERENPLYELYQIRLISIRFGRGNPPVVAPVFGGQRLAVRGSAQGHDPYPFILFQAQRIWY
ncbi:MAG: hypothetical protein VKK80_09835 [Prochlorothrix sp.]|nr:hypothetical protein [Prochlorothrix sp.]